MRRAIFLLSIGIILATASVSGQEAAQWVTLTSGATNDFNAISCPEESVCYIVGGAPFIGGNGIILKTIDGGDSWSQQSIPVTNPLRGISCPTATLCYAAGDGGALLKTINGGASWARLGVNTPAADQWYWDIAAADASQVTAVGNAGSVYRTTNGGTTWSRVELNTAENLHRLHFANAAIGWIVGTGGKVWKTINGGASWSSLTPPAGLNSLYAVDSRDGLNVWVGGDVGRILKSTNGGLAWTLLRPDTISSFRALSFINGTTGWIGGGGVIKRTDDGGASWVEEETGIAVTLRDMFCTNAVCYALGDDGVIMRRGQAEVEEEEEENLFNENLNATQKGIAEGPSKRTIGTKKLRGVTLNSNLLNQNRILFNLFIDQELIGEITEREERPNGVKIWQGQVEGQSQNRITLVSKGNITVGNIRTDEGVIEIRYAGSGAYTIRLIDPNLLPNDLHPGAPPVTATATPPPPRQVAPAETAVIDIMILLTPQAYDALGDNGDAVGAAIDLMLEEANQAYELSNAHIRLNWAHAQGVGGRIYNDSGDLEDDLNTLSSDRTMLGSLASNLQEDVGADLTTLLVRDGGGSCGIAWQMNESNEAGFAAIAFSVVDVDCLSNYSYPHELGHNMGLQHDRDNADSSPRYSYAYGYQDPQSRFRTIMAYPCRPECSRVPFFSTPDPSLAYQGIPFGTATEDNARALRNIRGVVADYSETRGEGEAADAESSGDEAAAFSEFTGIKSGASSAGASGFFKNLGRGIKTFFAFDSEKRAEFKLKFANEDILTAQKLLADGKEADASRTLEDFSKNLDAAEKLASDKLKPKILETQLKQQNLLRALSREVKSDLIKEKILNLRTKELERAVSSLEKVGEKDLEEVLEKVSATALSAPIKILVAEKQKKTIETMEVEKKEDAEKEIKDEKGEVKEEIKEPVKIEIETKPAPTLEPEPVVCTKDYSPVCGANNLTYQNECFLKQAGITAAYKGECQKAIETKTETKTIEESTAVLTKPTIVSFTASPTSISYKESVTLSWSISGADSILLENTKETLSASGKKTVAPAKTTTYTITAANKAGSVSSSVTVYVKSSY